MIPDRTVLLTTVTVVLVVAVSGPLVPGVAFTAGAADGTDASADYRPFATGAAEVSVEKRLALGTAAIPERGVLVRTDGGYRPDVGAVELPVEAGYSPAVVVYALRIPDLDVDGETTATVPAGTGRSIRLDAPAPTVPADAVTAERYEATVAVSVELDDRSLPVAEGTVPLEVER
jgi:hypothetical protein